MNKSKAKCCLLECELGKVDCQKDAEWVIHTQPDPYAITYACTEHVGYLLEDSDYAIEVWSIDKEG